MPGLRAVPTIAAVMTAPAMATPGVLAAASTTVMVMVMVVMPVLALLIVPGMRRTACSIRTRAGRHPIGRGLGRSAGRETAHRQNQDQRPQFS